MQVSCDLVDWKWLKGLAGPRAQVDALLEAPDQKVVPCTAVVKGWVYRPSDHDDMSDALESLAGRSDEEKAQLLRTGLMCLITTDECPDPLGLADESEGCFYATVAPKQVKAAAGALAKLDLAAVAAEINSRRRKSVERYLRQWAAVIQRASETGMGIVAHMG
jgi:hypothetical protein